MKNSKSYLDNFVDWVLEEFLHHGHFNAQHSMRHPFDARITMLVDSHANVFAFMPPIKVNETKRQGNVQRRQLVRGTSAFSRLKRDHQIHESGRPFLLERFHDIFAKDIFN